MNHPVVGPMRTLYTMGVTMVAAVPRCVHLSPLWAQRAYCPERRGVSAGLVNEWHAPTCIKESLTHVDVEVSRLAQPPLRDGRIAKCGETPCWDIY